ncbi:MAG: chitosanase [Cocleimonas sp.]|nr:chitosanase [Cocleimonas sp.]
MFLTETQRSLIERVINKIETGRPEGDYGKVSIYSDGPHGMRQITYGRAQTTEYSNLRKLVKMYVSAGGLYSAELAQYADRIGSESLTRNNSFKGLLRKAGRKDAIMKKIQDQFFEQYYFMPAMVWADDHGLTKALSALVIYDSFIHSGQIFWFLRQRFAANPPSSGGTEEEWVHEYLKARHNWLKNHRIKILRKTIYRTSGLLAQIEKNNWDLSRLPIKMNGTDVYPNR